MPGARVSRGDHVTLRPAEREDVPFLARQNNPDLRLPTGHAVTGQAQIEDWVETAEAVTSFVVCLEDGDVSPGPVGADEVTRVGVASAIDHDPNRPELAFFIVPEHQGQGFGREAIEMLVDYTFEAFPHPAVGAETFPENGASRGLLESLGFTQEGRIRRDVFWDGRYRDLVQYGLLRSEWREQG